MGFALARSVDSSDRREVSLLFQTSFDIVEPLCLDVHVFIRSHRLNRFVFSALRRALVRRGRPVGKHLARPRQLHIFSAPPRIAA